MEASIRDKERSCPNRGREEGEKSQGGRQERREKRRMQGTGEKGKAGENWLHKRLSCFVFLR